MSSRAPPLTPAPSPEPTGFESGFEGPWPGDGPGGDGSRPKRSAGLHVRVLPDRSSVALGRVWSEKSDSNFVEQPFHSRSAAAPERRLTSWIRGLPCLLSDWRIACVRVRRGRRSPPACPSPRAWAGSYAPPAHSYCTPSARNMRECLSVWKIDSTYNRLFLYHSSVIGVMMSKRTLLFTCLTVLLIVHGVSAKADLRKNVFWIHGSIAQPSPDNADVNVLPVPVGAWIIGQGGPQEVWIPINTPAILEDTNAYLAYVTLVFETANGAKLETLNIWHRKKDSMGSDAFDLSLEGDYTIQRPGNDWVGYRIGFEPPAGGPGEGDFVADHGINIVLGIDFSPCSEVLCPLPPFFHLVGVGLEYWRWY